MTNTQKNELKNIVKDMIDALEVPKKKVIKGKTHTIITGDYVCHEDIPEKIPEYDAHFLVCGEKESSRYLVLIKHVK